MQTFSVIFLFISFLWSTNSETAFGPVFRSVKIVPSIGTQTGTFIFLHWFGGQTPWWLLLYHRLVPSYVKSIFPTARSDIDRNLFCIPLPSWYQAIIPLSLENPEDEAGILNAVVHLHELIYNEMRKGIPAERIVLGGISQGGALAFIAGLTFPYRLAGIVVQSAYLPLSRYFRNDFFTSNLINKNIPILQLHGAIDPLVPFYIAIQTSKIIKRFNLNYRLQFTVSGHHPDLNALLQTKSFIQAMIPPNIFY